VTARAVGVLGGTFDPVHVGHLAVGEVARTALDLESVLFVPALQPPHKRDQAITDARHREAMLRLAIADTPAFEVSRLELERPGPSYSVDTLEQVAAESAAAGRADPWFILSVEAVAGFPSWRDPDRILALARIAVAPRPGSEPPSRAWLEARFPGRVDRFASLPGPDVSVSATEIRRRVADGLSIDGFVPPAVERYIMEHRLYLAADEPDRIPGEQRSTDEQERAER
jgi:nicotinate-nucleotide adenylyltransferase